MTRRDLLSLLLVPLMVVATAGCGDDDQGWAELPVDAGFDYQIGGDYDPADGVETVSRDWFAGSPLAGDPTYSICYVNAFQTQPDEPGVDRPDERSDWPDELVLTDLGDDPNWEGEYLIDISTAERREAALAHITPMIETCAGKGFDAVEYDNLDSWVRFDHSTPADQVPFGRTEAVAFAELLVDAAHRLGLAAAQKNTLALTREESIDLIGFDFAVAEQCGEFDECDGYRAVFGDRLVVIEYSEAGFEAACSTVGDSVSVVLRDLDVTTPDAESYRFEMC
jgi:hypothetical protein